MQQSHSRALICLEGPSAVGKTTTSRALAKQMRAAVVPEVNVLFTRPLSEHEDWYLERQAERWAIARQALTTYPLVVLDGDPFQPLWYNWSFGFQGLQSLDALQKFYRPLIVQEALNFPDVYIHLVIDPQELRRRKEADDTRSRRSFEQHLRLVDTQQRYFAAMASLAPALVVTVEAVSVENNLRCIGRVLRTPHQSVADPLSLFDGLMHWLRCHKAQEE